MTHLEVTIQSKQQEHPFPEWKDGQPLYLKAVNIVEGLTPAGRTGVEFLVEDYNGKKYFMLSTGRMVLNGIGGTLRGAMERFNDDPNMA